MHAVTRRKPEASPSICSTQHVTWSSSMGCSAADNKIAIQKGSKRSTLSSDAAIVSACRSLLPLTLHTPSIGCLEESASTTQNGRFFRAGSSNHGYTVAHTRTATMAEDPNPMCFAFCKGFGYKLIPGQSVCHVDYTTAICRAIKDVDNIDAVRFDNTVFKQPNQYVYQFSVRLKKQCRPRGVYAKIMAAIADTSRACRVEIGFETADADFKSLNMRQNIIRGANISKIFDVRQLAAPTVFPAAAGPGQKAFEQWSGFINLVEIRRDLNRFDSLPPVPQICQMFRSAITRIGIVHDVAILAKSSSSNVDLMVYVKTKVAPTSKNFSEFVTNMKQASGGVHVFPGWELKYNNIDPCPEWLEWLGAATIGRQTPEQAVQSARERHRLNNARIVDKHGLQFAWPVITDELVKCRSLMTTTDNEELRNTMLQRYAPVVHKAKASGDEGSRRQIASFLHGSIPGYSTRDSDMIEDGMQRAVSSGVSDLDQRYGNHLAEIEACSARHNQTIEMYREQEAFSRSRLANHKDLARIALEAEEAQYGEWKLMNAALKEKKRIRDQEIADCERQLNAATRKLFLLHQFKDIKTSVYTEVMASIGPRALQMFEASRSNDDAHVLERIMIIAAEATREMKILDYMM
jgi:hypothetical protein